MDELMLKYEKLLEYFKKLENVTVAFSSGVDSTLLLWAAKEALQDRVLAVTAASVSFPMRELEEAKDYCKKLGLKHVVFSSEELAIPGFLDNPPDRCYLCKKELFGKMCEISKEHSIPYICEGSNLDDNKDYRPGHKAIAELGVKSPLRDIGFTKAEIRELSKRLDLPTWNKQSFACLATRFVYGERISAEKLKMIDLAEQLLLDMGYSQVRVRVHGDMARIEVAGDELLRLMQEDHRTKVYDTLKEIGFTYVTLDMAGYRQGSMNDVILKDSSQGF